MGKRGFDWDGFDGVILTFWVVKPFDTREVAQTFLGILEHHGYAPDRLSTVWTKDRWVKLQQNMDEYYRGWLERRPKAVSKHVMLRRTCYPRGTMNVDISADGRFPFDFLDVVLEADYFREGPGQQRFLQMAKDLYTLVNPAYGMLEDRDTSISRTGIIDLERGLPGIFWGNFLGPEYTAMLGWEKLEALGRELPVTVERLPDDGVLIVLGGNVLDSGTPEMLARAEAVEQFLGEEYFSKTSPPKPLPFSMTDALAGKVPPEVLRKYLMPPKPRQGKVPEFRFRELRQKRQEEWERSGGITVEELIEEVGLEIKGPGGVIMVDAATGKAYDLPGEMFGEGDEGEEE